MNDQALIGEAELRELNNLVKEHGLLDLGMRFLWPERLLLRRLADRHQTIVQELTAAGVPSATIDHVLREFIYGVYEQVAAAHIGHRKLWSDMLPKPDHKTLEQE